MVGARRLGRILVVDDDPLNVRLLSVLLGALGYDVAGASDAAGAFSAIAGFSPDLVLLDLRLPDLDGIDVARRLKTDSATRHIPIIALTAAERAGLERAALAAGCAACLPKPIDTRTLPDLIAKHLAGPRERAGPSEDPTA